ncbi:MAG: PLP-dependent aspartate aminotransferase family protein [Pseudomonadota bacterium]
MSGSQGDRQLSVETYAVQGTREHDPETGAVIPSIDVTTTYLRDPDNGYSRGFVYGRADNATVRRCEDVITRLEGGRNTLVYGSGMAAATTFFLALERPAHVIAPNVMYWSLRNWLMNDAASHGLTVSFVDATDTGAIKEAIRPGQTKAIWLETPANPLWGISDISMVSDAAHAVGAVVGVDATTASPVLMNPLSLGADVVMHSATKYLNGHSDVVAGSLTFAASNETQPIEDRARSHRLSLGSILGSFEASLLLRGLRTLFVRVRAQTASALTIANHFDEHAAIEAVLYPGLPTAPGHTLAKSQMPGGFGGMLSIRCRGGIDHAITTAARVQVWTRATSLGGVESLIEHRASVEGAGTPCPDDLLRLSVGLEPAEDLIADLEHALAR